MLKERHERLQPPFRTHLGGQDGPEQAQQVLQRSPGRPKTTLGQFKRVPRRLRMAPVAPERPKMSPRSSQESPKDTPMGVSQEAQDGLRAHPPSMGNQGGEGLTGAGTRSNEGGGRVHAILGPARYPSSQGPSSSTRRRKKKSPSDFKMAQDVPSRAFGQFLVEE